MEDPEMVNHVKRVKTSSAIALLALTTLCTNLTYFRGHRNFDPQAVGKDEIMVYEQRFEELRKVLPERAVVGYIHDQIDQEEAGKSYFLTQYALTPNIVVMGTEPELIVGNFNRPDTEAEKVAGESLITLQDYGNGVMLFKKKAR